ncbi:MAG: SAVED domain-containing protein [Chloroflexi bacterium]|nr:SAVED domain-containing protein [Chloroflexota bacterium]
MSTSPRSTWRNVTERDKIILWGRSAARCNHPGCKQFLVEPASTKDTDATFGQAAHIVAHGKTGPRADPAFDSKLKDIYDNLILLCGNHHAIVDKQPNTYTVDHLRTWKEEHETWVRGVTEPDKNDPVRWAVVIHESEPSINAQDALSALDPQAEPIEPVLLRVSQQVSGWDDAAREQTRVIRDLLGSLAPADRRIAIFSLAPIPLGLHLGFVISDRCRVDLYQYDRDEMSWAWPENPVLDNPIRPVEWRDETPLESGDAVVRVALSAEISSEDIRPFVPEPLIDVRITVERPSITWLQSRGQLRELGTAYRHALERIRHDFGMRCKRIHLFYAGPAGGAVLLGRQHNPHMDVPVQTYQYDVRRSPRYEPALLLRGN